MVGSDQCRIMQRDYEFPSISPGQDPHSLVHLEDI